MGDVDRDFLLLVLGGGGIGALCLAPVVLARAFRALVPRRGLGGPAQSPPGVAVQETLSGT